MILRRTRRKDFLIETTQRNLNNLRFNDHILQPLSTWIYIYNYFKMKSSLLLEIQSALKIKCIRKNKKNSTRWDMDSRQTDESLSL